MATGQYVQMNADAYHFDYMGNLELSRLRCNVCWPRANFILKSSQLLGLSSTRVTATVLVSVVLRVRILTRRSVYVGVWQRET